MKSDRELLQQARAFLRKGAALVPVLRGFARRADEGEDLDLRNALRKAANVLEGCDDFGEELDLNRTERRRKARTLLETIVFQRDQTIAAAELCLRLAQDEWERVRPAEPGHITIGEAEFALPDVGRATAEQLAAAINAGATMPGLTARVEGSSIYIVADACGPDCFGGSDEDSHYAAQTRITAKDR